MKDDVFYMKKAITLARKGGVYGVANVSPNPLVGAIIVLWKNGKDVIIGKGYHKVFGGAHAEVVAINDALKNGYCEKDFRHSTLYVNLEPCCHFGKTGPCCEEIVRRKFKRVVVAHKDPSSKVDGKGIKYLKDNQVKVDIGVCEDLAREINQPFLKISKIGIPYVTLKSGITLDGRISTGRGKAEWITNQFSRKHGYALRLAHDAIVVGANTVIVDDPKLMSGKDRKGKLFRVILDGKLRTNPSYKVFRDQNVLVAHTDLAKKSDVKKFTDASVKVKSFGKDKVNIKELLKYLYKEFGIMSVFVEGGGEVNGSFVDAKMIDTVYFYIAPEILGGRNSISVVEGNGVESVKDDLKIKKLNVKNLNGDILISGNINEY